MASRSLHWLWLLGLAAAGPAVAQEPHLAPPDVASPSSERALISPRRIPGLSLDANAVPANVTVITAEDIRRSRASTIQEVLSRLEGVTFSDQQGFGLSSNATVNLRGIVNSARTNTLVLVDGIRQNRITGDEVQWQAIPIDQVERIEVIRGGGGLVYGEGALAGVINVYTTGETQRILETEQGVEIGSFGWQKYYTKARGTHGPARYGMAYSRRLVDGYRESSWSRNTTIRAHGGVDLGPDAALDVHVTHSDDTTAFPGLLTLAQSQARQQQTNPFFGFNTTETDQVGVDLTAGSPDGLVGTMSAFWSRRVQTSEDSVNFGFFTVAPSRGLSVRTSHTIAGDRIQHGLVSGLELGEDKATTGDRIPGPDSETNRAGYGAYVEETLTFDERLTLVGGLRFDKSRYEASLSFPDYNGTLRFEGWSPKLGLSYRLIPERMWWFASYARPFKAPNVDDFSSRLGSIARSNADLVPQQADTYELGTRVTAGGLEARLTGFYIRVDDEILFNSLVFTNQNFDTRRLGCELSVRARNSADSLRSYAAYTFVDAEFRKGAFTGRTVPGAPEHTLNAGLGVSPLSGLWVDLDWRLVHDMVRVNDFNNLLGQADNYGVLNLVVQYDLPRRGARWPTTSLYARIDNLTNEEYVTYQASNGADLTGAGEAPMPPTTFTGGVTVRF